MYTNLDFEKIVDNQGQRSISQNTTSFEISNLWAWRGYYLFCYKSNCLNVWQTDIIIKKAVVEYAISADTEKWLIFHNINLRPERW